jgi:hypothetical protein
VSDVDVPKVGKVKRTYLYAGGAAVAGYVLWRYHQASQAAAAPAPDPESAGTIGADIGSGAGGYYDPNGADGVSGDTTVGTVVSTDQQWYAAALLALEDAGYDTGAAALALGKYLRSEPLTAREQDMVKVALAAAGPPPSGARAVVTDNSPTPSGLRAPQGLRSGGTPTTAAIPLVWTSVAGASGYVVYRGSAQLGTVTGTSYTATGLSPNTAYTFTVRATNTGGALSPASAPYSARTAAAPSKPAPPPTSGGPKPKPAPPKVPAYHVRFISPSIRTLSELVADDNRRTGRHHTTDQVWNFNLQYRKPTTVTTLRKRGKDSVFVGSSFWIPNA